MKTLHEFLTGEAVVQLLIRIGLLGLLIAWTFVLINPFIPILAWAVVLAVALNPVYVRLAATLGGRPKLAAGLLTAVNLALVIAPAAWLGVGAVEGVRELAAKLSAGELTVPSPPDAILSWPLIGPTLHGYWQQASTNLREVLHQVAPHLKPVATALLSLAGDAGLGVLKFLLSVIVAGVLFPYGSQLVAAGRDFLAKIVPERSEHFLSLASATIRAVSLGVIGVAVLQSLLAGVAFKLAAIPSAGLLAFLVLLLAIVQIGSAPIVLPAIVWIWTVKDATTAALLTVFLIFVGLIDNVLKPLVMGRGLTTPTLVILFGVIGGTLAHGIVGLFVGPIVLSVAWEFAAAWARGENGRPPISAP